MMKRFDHDNIVKLLGVCTRGEPAYAVMEFMLHGKNAKPKYSVVVTLKHAKPKYSLVVTLIHTKPKYSVSGNTDTG